MTEQQGTQADPTGAEKTPPTAEQTLGNLVAAYGPERVKAAAEELLGRVDQVRQIPAQHVPVLHPMKLADTVTQLDASVDDLLTLGDKREAAYNDKGGLLKEKQSLETQIMLRESEAWMGTAQDGKSVNYDGKTWATSNDTLRDAFKRFVTKDLQQQLSDVQGKLAQVEIQIIQARDAYEKVATMSESIRSKAFVQARLLQFLAGGY